MSQNDPLRSFGREARAGESGMSSHRAGEAPTWNEERIEQLKVLWEQGLSASSIGRVLGVTKNAVVGKAHRLKLSSRPSPIRKSSKPPVRRATVLARPTLPNAPMVALRNEAAPTTDCNAKAPAREAPAKEAKALGMPAATARQPLPTGESFSKASVGQRRTAKTPAGRITKCLWPIGDPGDSDFRFCGADSLPGKPYCSEHCARAYVTKSRADSEAA